VLVINKTDKAYEDLLKRILSEGKLRGDRTGTGTISIFSHTLEMDMADGFPLLTTKKMFTKGIIHELLWFLKGSTNIKYLVDNGVNIWTPDAYREYKKVCLKAKEDGHTDEDPLDILEFGQMIKTDNHAANLWGELGPVYGAQWRDWGLHGEDTPLNKGIDQIQQVIDKLNNKPEDRRIMVSAWNVAEIDKMALPPCHWAFEFYTEELTNDERYNLLSEEEKRTLFHDFEYGKEVSYTLDNFYKHIPKRRLHLKWHQRSVDTFLGLPFNIASYALLLHMVAQQCNMVPDKLVGDLTNVHIYNNHVEQCEEQISREPMGLAKLELNKADDIFSYTFDDIKMVGYKSHSPINGEISV
jgi:thymidylate synthase